TILYTLLTQRPPISQLFPYTTLFRSNGNKTTNLTSKEAKMGKVMRHTLGASLNIRHNLSSSKGPKPLQLKLLTTYIPKTSAFTLAFSTSQRLRTTRASARTFFTRSEERRVGKECRSRWTTSELKTERIAGRLCPRMCIGTI